jgi:long-chain acyl-CoA synthetase
MLTGFRAGISIVMMPRFSGREALALMTKHRCTEAYAKPRLLRPIPSILSKS